MGSLKQLTLKFRGGEVSRDLGIPQGENTGEELNLLSPHHCWLPGSTCCRAWLCKSCRLPGNSFKGQVHPMLCPPGPASSAVTAPVWCLEDSQPGRTKVGGRLEPVQNLMRTDTSWAESAVQDEFWGGFFWGAGFKRSPTTWPGPNFSPAFVQSPPLLLEPTACFLQTTYLPEFFLPCPTHTPVSPAVSRS